MSYGLLFLALALAPIFNNRTRTWSATELQMATATAAHLSEQPSHAGDKVVSHLLVRHLPSTIKK